MSVESRISEYFGLPNVCLVNSWTNGFAVALTALRLKKYDEVIIPAITFVSVANMVVLNGLCIKIADVDPLTSNLNWEGLAPLITENTRVIVLVHMYGLMVDVSQIRNELREIGREDIFIIEDCAHAFESEIKGSKPGLCSDLAIFSFYATKNVSCGEGGALVSSNAKLIDACRSLRLHGMTKNAFDRYQSSNYSHYDVTCPGFKANLPDVLAALLPEEIDLVDKRQTVREEKYRIYRNLLGEIDQSMLREDYDARQIRHAHHLFPIFVEPSLREFLLQYLPQRGVGVAVNFRSITQFTAYKSFSAPIAEMLGLSEISLPFFPDISIEEMEYVVRVIRDGSSIHKT
jgi:dTDP-4-amino-4,6-dideoxygalactose transaminase